MDYDAPSPNYPQRQPSVETVTMQHEIEIEVRYYETDGQAIVHHANYFKYFELARVKMLQSAGFDYAELERQGIILVVHSIACRYLLPAVFGDTLQLVTKVDRATAARLDHSYQVFRGDVLLAEGNSTLACVNAEGVVQRMPACLVENKDHVLPKTHLDLQEENSPS